MFEHLPLLGGRYFTYRQYFPILFATTASLTAALVLLAAVVVGRARRGAAGVGGGDGLLGASGGVELELSTVGGGGEGSASDGTSGGEQGEGSAAGKDAAAVTRLRQNLAVLLLGLGQVFSIWFVWTLKAFGITGWGGWIAAIVGTLGLLALWPLLWQRLAAHGYGCGLWETEAAAAEYYELHQLLLPWFAAFAASYALLQPSAWGYLPLQAGALLGAAPLVLVAGVRPLPPRCCRQLRRRCGNGRRARLARAAGWLCWGSLWAAALHGSCIAYFNTDEEGLHLGPVLFVKW